MARGMAAVEMAKTPKDYKRAVLEFEQAAKLAPNWPDVYFNLGSVQAKAGNYGEAMRHYKRYLELAPKAPDAAKVREEIYKLEYRAEEEKLRKERERFSLEDGVIYDSKLGLEWAPSNGKALNHYQAESYARDLSLAGGGWRLPTRAELKSLYDTTKPGNVDPVFNVGDKWVWTSELYNEITLPAAVGFYFYDGGEKAGDRANSKHQDNRRVLAVRSGQSILDSEKASAASHIAAAYKTGAYKGVRNYENGDKYEGEFTNRNLNGKGTYTYANGDKYEGEFVDGKFTSRGTFTCSNGKQFTGNLENKVPLEFTIRCN